MKRSVGFCLVFLACGVLHAQVLDPTFGTGGIVNTSLVPGFDIARGLLVQPDGRIVAYGTADINSDSSNALIARYEADGSLDGSFGVGGLVLIAVDQEAVAWTGQLQDDGKIIVGGRSKVGQDWNKFLFRVLPDGSPDPGFGNNGLIRLDDQPDSGEDIWDLALQSDGKVVVTGFTTFGPDAKVYAARFHGNGQLDTSFADLGILHMDVSEPDARGRCVAVDTDGRIMIAAETSTPTNGYDIAVLRLLSDGQVDTMFGDSGVVILHWSNTYDLVTGLVIQADGKILLAGTDSANHLHGRFMVNRLLDNGDPDSSFYQNGIRPLIAGDRYTRCEGLLVDSEGMILVAGIYDPPNSFWIFREHYMCRMFPDGALDTGFGVSGQYIGPEEDGPVFDIALQADGKILLGGGTAPNTMGSVLIKRFTESIMSVSEPQPDAPWTMAFGQEGLVLRSLEAGKLEYRLFDMLGRTLDHGSAWATVGAPVLLPVPEHVHGVLGVQVAINGHSSAKLIVVDR